MIVFENEGSLDLRCVRNMGVNVKETDSAIGFFGTGLKYAIATWLRNDCKVTLVVNGETYEFSAKEEEIRNKTFRLVTMNGDEIGFTTDLGKNWEPWMAYRELYSNALDEPDHRVYSQRAFPECKPGRTYVIVQGNAANKVHSQRHMYFLAESEREPLHTFALGEVEFYEQVTQQAGQGVIFYRGIKVGETGNHAIYDYNLIGDCSLTEDRTLRYHWEPHWAITRAMLRMNGDHSWQKDLLRRMLTAPMGSFENRLDYQHTPASPTEFFLDVVAELRNDAVDHFINPSALSLLYKNRKNSDLPARSVKLNKVQEAQLEKATRFCKEVLEFEDLDDFPIIVCENLGKGHLGRADMDDDKIYIAKKCFDNGTKRIAVALLEEYTHCKHRVEDETVEQKWIYLEQIISLGERIQGEPL